MINKHKSNKIKENSNRVRHLNNGTDHHHSKSCCDQSSPARRTTTTHKQTNTQGETMITSLAIADDEHTGWKHYITSLSRVIIIIFENQRPESGPSYRRQVVHPRPQTPQAELVAKPGTPLFIVSSLICKPDIKEARSVSSNPLFKKNVRGRKHPREMDKCKTRIQILIISGT